MRQRARAFIDELQRAGYTGDVSAKPVDRALASTDAGNYRVVPVLRLAPRETEEVQLIHRISRDLEIPLTARGAGTSCAGNAIGPGVIVDYFPHLNRILNIDADSRTATVQPGVIEGQLQAAAAKYGLRFGPDPSTANRCTIGGMIGNNACGPHATAWGRTADNVLNMRVIDGIGRSYSTADGIETVAGLSDFVAANLDTIRLNFGRFKRQVSGYSLEHLLPENGADLTRFLVGSENTLVSVTEATLRLVPVPEAAVLVALGYESIFSAADDVPMLLEHEPLAIEGMDSRLIDVVRAHRGPGAVPELPDGTAWLLVEVGGAQMGAEESLAAAHALAAAAATPATAVYAPGSEASALWRIRADGAGLGGRTPVNPDGGGNRQGWPGFEDTAVPPDHLGEYLRELHELMTDRGVDGLMYGHFGDGCMHVRLDLPLDTEAGVRRARDFLIAGAELVAKHGGSISGEHGDGRARSELLRITYPEEAYRLFGQVKALFDPANLLNPGVLADPDPLDINLRRPAAHPQPAIGGFAFSSDDGDFTTAVHRCTGVGKCRADLSGSGGFMCPTYQATGEDAYATRGRARILQEAANGSMIHGIDDPYLTEVLDMCMACKACSKDCPAGVDMAAYRSEWLYRRYRGRLRPRPHYLLGWLPRWLRLAARIPGAAVFANAAMSFAPLRRLAFRVSGIDIRRQMPRLATGSFDRDVRALGADTATSVPHSPRGTDTPKYVVVWADTFSRYLSGGGADALVELLVRAGYRVLVAPPDACCGLTWITTGQLPAARKHIEHLTKRLAPFALAGIPIIGVEPSCTAAVRDDAAKLLPDDSRVRALAGGVFTFAEFAAAEKLPLPDLTGVRVVAQPHCHHYSVMGWETDRELLKQAGADLVELSGCCGMAGNYGMENGHYEISQVVANRALLPALSEHSGATYLADGFSCRTQAAQLAGREGVTLPQLWLAHSVG